MKWYEICEWKKQHNWRINWKFDFKFFTGTIFTWLKIYRTKKLLTKQNKCDNPTFFFSKQNTIWNQNGKSWPKIYIFIIMFACVVVFLFSFKLFWFYYCCRPLRLLSYDFNLNYFNSKFIRVRCHHFSASFRLFGLSLRRKKSIV